MDKKKIIIAIVAVLAVIAIAIGVSVVNKDTKTVYTISFNTDGGNEVISQEIKEGEKVTKPVDPSKEGYEFLGWYLNGEYFNFETGVEGDLTLEAKWKEIVVEEDNKDDDKVEEDKKEENKDEDKEEQEKVTKYTVKFESNGGSKVSKQTVEKNKTVKAPADPTRDGYIFKGWYLGSAKYNFSKKVTKNITLKAKWEKIEEQKPEEEKPNTQPEVVKEYAVTFNTDGGSQVKAQTVKENGTATKPSNPTKKSSDSTTVYIFKGWYADGKEFNFSTKITKDITITAKWDVLKIKEYPVPNSVANEVMIYLELNNVKVAGTIQMTSVSGKTVTVNVPATGVEKTKGTYTSLSNPKVK